MSVSGATAGTALRNALAWVRTDSGRRLGGWILGALIVALMTGPSGNDGAPTAGFTGSLLHPRVLVFLGLGVAFWVLTNIRRRYGERIRSASDRVHRDPEPAPAHAPRPLRPVRGRPGRGHRLPTDPVGVLAGGARRPDRGVRAPGRRTERGRRVRRPARPRLHRLLRHRGVLRRLLDRRSPRSPPVPPESVLGHTRWPCWRRCSPALSSAPRPSGCEGTTSPS